MSTALEKYKVVFEPRAVNDLNEIVKYISYTLKEPEIAKRIYNSIKKHLLSLESMPYCHKLLDDELFRNMEIRKIPVENYTAFYFVNEKSKSVHIFRILHNRREWKNLL